MGVGDKSRGQIWKEMSGLGYMTANSQRINRKIWFLEREKEVSDEAPYSEFHRHSANYASVNLKVDRNKITIIWGRENLN